MQRLRQYMICILLTKFKITKIIIVASRINKKTNY